MLSWFHQLLPCCLLEAAFSWGGAFGQLESKFEICKLRLGRILNGTETFRGINNETIQHFLYRGPVAGMKPEYAEKSRDEFITITTESCRWTLTDSLTGLAKSRPCYKVAESSAMIPWTGIGRQTSP